MHSQVQPATILAERPLGIPDPVLLKRLGSPTSYAPARDIYIPEDDEDEDGRSPKKNSGRSTCLYRDPNDALWKIAEGQLEMNVGLRFLADRNVVLIEPQYGPTHYLTTKGRRTHTIWDFRVHKTDHTKGVVAAKPATKAAKHGTAELSKHIFSQMQRGEADRVQTITDHDLPAWALANYRLLHSVRNDRDRPFETEMRAAAGGLIRPRSLGDFCKRWGGMGMVGRTAAYLIFDGTLAMADPASEISSESLVTAGVTQDASAAH
ncbi:hypothetical protein [Devosia sp.]|uniref:hypothetical protein n=1 Tax=Devosia sp. TaxID=1871048 RepID=UPI001AC5DEED|nr:hypothetical protein [Devosia sp.]MBN9335191.1 hypothetical protein [Devosia sp.]